LVTEADEGRVTVRLPTALIRLLGGERNVAVRGDTLREVMDDLMRCRPDVALHLFNESGELRGNVLCFCNDVLTRSRQDLSAPVRPGDTITILNSVAGG
jgi:molybdopterin synthase sulfur carrier subunit